MHRDAQVSRLTLVEAIPVDGFEFRRRLQNAKRAGERSVSYWPDAEMATNLEVFLGRLRTWRAAAGDAEAAMFVGYYFRNATVKRDARGDQFVVEMRAIQRFLDEDDADAGAKGLLTVMDIRHVTKAASDLGIVGACFKFSKAVRDCAACGVFFWTTPNERPSMDVDVLRVAETRCGECRREAAAAAAAVAVAASPCGASAAGKRSGPGDRGGDPAAAALDCCLCGQFLSTASRSFLKGPGAAGGGEGHRHRHRHRGCEMKRRGMFDFVDRHGYRPRVDNPFYDIKDYIRRAVAVPPGGGGGCTRPAEGDGGPATRRRRISTAEVESNAGAGADAQILFVPEPPTEEAIAAVVRGMLQEAESTGTRPGVSCDDDDDDVVVVAGCDADADGHDDVPLPSWPSLPSDTPIEDVLCAF